MNTQPEPLRLADWHRAMADEPKRNEAKRLKHLATEAELRRLHALNAELLEALVKIRQGALNQTPHTGISWKNVSDIAQAAIAKAIGET